MRRFLAAMLSTIRGARATRRIKHRAGIEANIPEKAPGKPNLPHDKEAATLWYNGKPRSILWYNILKDILRSLREGDERRRRGFFSPQEILDCIIRRGECKDSD